jgi:hypothetical protein
MGTLQALPEAVGRHVAKKPGRPISGAPRLRITGVRDRDPERERQVPARTLFMLVEPSECVIPETRGRDRTGYKISSSTAARSFALANVQIRIS